jgi:ubiquitin carboxyl-terminal hydrolase 8
MNGVDSYKTGPRVYSHIEDLMNVRPQVDINSPIRKILQDAEMIAKQADSLLDFHRPELALQEYLRASIIVAEIIPRHKDYPSLHTNNGDLHRVHKGLMKRIKAQDAKFDAVIQTIKDNNSRNGTQATRNLLTNSISVQNSDHSSIVSKSSGTSSSGSNGVQGRKKPLVQPKPEGLHGRPLQTSSQPTAKPQISQIDTDLATRFARLRSLHPQNAMNAQSVLQDSRIRTQPILIPNSPHAPMYSPLTPRSGKGSTTVRPVGPRELPSIPLSAPSQSKIPLDVQIPAMPKPPDAIYSPASSADAASINLPSSVTRSSSYLGNPKNSAPPISRVVATPAITDHRLDYFSPAHKVENPGSAQDPNKRYLLNSPGDLYLSAEALVDYLGLGTQTLRPLIVDLRSREQFDSGHVMAQSIICIEPITIREGISAEEIGESIILSPDAEQKLYDKRHEFDLVVFYDQSSSALEIGTTGHSQGNKYLEQFSKAVYDYGYEKQLRQRPLLLRGGLDAWVDLMGPGSLKSSTPSSGGMLKPSRPVGRMSITRDFRGNSLRGARQSRPFSRPFSKEEETKWDEAIKGEADNKDKLDDPDSEEFSYARTTEDFFRKYPELPSIQESMISQPRFPIREEHNEFDAVVPRPPARPPPALPRQRSSGISEKSPTATYAMTSTSNSITPLSSKAGLTGLNNLHSVTCYVNSVIQCLSATPIIRQYLLNEYTYSKDSCPPKKDDEQGPPPQLLTRNLTNLLRILWSGQYDWVMPKTFLVSNIHL